MRVFASLAAAVALAAWAPRPARAQASTFAAGQSLWGTRLGLAYPTQTNRFQDEVRGGFTAGFHYWRYPADWFGWGVDLGYALYRKRGFDGQRYGAAFTGIPFSAQASALSALGLVRLNITPGRSWTPYVLGGAGLNRFFFKLTTPAGSSKPASTDLALAAGGGVEAFLGRNASAALEGRWQEFRLRRSRGFNAPAAETMLLTMNLNYWFGLR